MTTIFPIEQVDVLHSHSAANPRAEATVVVPLYNYAHHVVETLDSVRRQDVRHLDLIVVDDQSSDGSADVVHAWMNLHESRFDRALLVRHRANAGLPTSRNTGISLSKTPFFIPLDADNTIYPRCLSRCLEVLEDERFGAAYTQLEHFGEQVGIGTADVWRKEWFVKGNYVDAMALIRRSVWERVGGYARMEVTGIEDYEFWCKCIDHEIKAAFVPEMLCRYRVHNQSMLRTTDTNRRVRALAELALRHPWISLQHLPPLKEALPLHPAALGAGGGGGEGRTRPGNPGPRKGAQKKAAHKKAAQKKAARRKERQEARAADAPKRRRKAAKARRRPHA